MPSQRAIVGIGDLLYVASPEGERAGGLAAGVPIHAAKLGYPAIAISRVGQDDSAQRIFEELAGHGVDVSHVQTDPDLATARLTIRRIGGRTTRILDPRAAFDNLQWDFDLEDVAQQTDSVVFGCVARRFGQTAITIDRFLAECRHALRVFDLTDRDDEHPVERSAIIRALEEVEALVVDRRALEMIAPESKGQPEEVVASSILKQQRLTFIVSIQNRRLTSFSGGEVFSVSETIDADATNAAIVALLHGLLSGWDWKRSLAGAARYGRFTVEHPQEDVPADLFD